MKTCPFCAEEIKDAAVVCRYCKRELPEDGQHVDRVKCPSCAEWIRANAITCRHCGKSISVSQAHDARDNEPTKAQSEQVRRKIPKKRGFGSIVGRALRTGFVLAAIMFVNYLIRYNQAIVQSGRSSYAAIEAAGDLVWGSVTTFIGWSFIAGLIDFCFSRSRWMGFLAIIATVVFILLSINATY